MKKILTTTAVALTLALTPAVASAQGREHHCRPVVSYDVSLITRVFSGHADKNCWRAQNLERYVATHDTSLPFYVHGHRWVSHWMTSTTSMYQMTSRPGALVYITTSVPTG